MQTDENQNVSNQIKFLRFYDFSSDVRRILSTKSQHFLPSQTKANTKQNSLKITWRQHDNIWEWRATYSYVSSSNLFYSIHRQKKWCSKSWLTIFTSSSSATSLAPSFIVCIHTIHCTLRVNCIKRVRGVRVVVRVLAQHLQKYVQFSLQHLSYKILPREASRLLYTKTPIT